MEKETKHTPGTWVVETNAEYNGRRWSCLVSTLHGMHCIEGGTAGEAKANAELIASAPTLKAEIKEHQYLHLEKNKVIASLQTELSEMREENEAHKIHIDELKAIETHLHAELSEMKKENERLKKENKVIYGSEMVQLSDYQDLKKEREELVKEIEVVRDSHPKGSYAYNALNGVLSRIKK